MKKNAVQITLETARVLEVRVFHACVSGRSPVGKQHGAEVSLQTPERALGDAATTVARRICHSRVLVGPEGHVVALMRNAVTVSAKGSVRIVEYGRLAKVSFGIKTPFPVRDGTCEVTVHD